MKPISQRARDIVFYSGWIILAIGVALFVLALERFDSLPNYQRIAVLIPVSLAWPLLSVDAFRDWSTTPVYDRLKAVASIMVLVMLVLASLARWIGAPDTYA